MLNTIIQPAAKAILVTMRASMWRARKPDNYLTREVNTAHGTVNAVKVLKNLFVGNAPEYDALKAALNTARSDHYFHTLRWERGVQLLPTKNSPAYNEAARRNKAAYADAKRAFLAAYEGLVERAKLPAVDGGLGSLFNERDYPAPSSIKGLISLEYEEDFLPQSGDFRIDGLSQVQIDRIQAQVDGRIKDATADAMANARERLGTVVQRMADTLAKQPGQKGYGFKGTLISGLQAELEVLKNLNLTDDLELEAMRQDVEDQLTTEDAQTLREDSSKRAIMAAKAAAMQKRMGSFYGVAK